MKRHVFFAAVLVLGLMFVACGNDEPTPDTEPGAAEASETPESMDPGTGTVTITSTEYEFDLPDTLPTGATTFTLANAGEEPHFIDIVPLTDDAPSVDKLIKMPEKKVEQYFAGPPNHIPTVKPGDTGTKTVEIDLVAGERYGYVCFIEDKDGTPHAFLGMAGEFVVQ